MAKTKTMVIALALLLGFCFVSALAAGDAVEIQIGYENNPGEPVDLGCKEWKRLVEEASGGSMKVSLYPSSQLGSKNDIMDQMIAGDSVITLADGGFFADRGVPDFSIVFAPYFYPSWDDCWKLMKSDWHKAQEAKLAKMGIKFLVGNWIYGVRHTLTTRPVRHVADLKGMKIRVPNNTMQIVSFEALGATPTPMPLGEVYTALQQGVIDGLENPLPVLYNGKFHEVAKYLTLDGHIRNTTNWICGTVFFNSLTPGQQKILVECGEKAGIYNNGVAAKATDEVLAAFKKEGVEIIEVDVQEFKKASESVYTNPAVAGKWTPGLYETVMKIMQAK